MKSKIFNKYPKLEDLLVDIYEFSIFDQGKPKSKITQLCLNLFKAIGWLLMIILCTLGSSEAYSFNNKFDRLNCFIALFATVASLSIEFSFRLRKNEILDFIDWSKRMEENKYELATNGKDWFKEGREKSMKFIR